MNRLATTAGLFSILLLIVVSSNATLTSSQGINWAAMRGVAYRSAANSYVCFQGLPSCDGPVVASPATSFAVYRLAGFNFARVSLDWRYMEQNPSGIKSILTGEANACDANSINCYYQFSAAGGDYSSPADVMTAWGCTTNPCYVGHLAANDIIPAGTGTPYDGQHVWTATWNGVIKPAIQLLDSHSSTVGYSVANEPGNGWSAANLKAYYLYMAQQIRTLSTKAFIFQANAGGGALGSLAPAGYGPYVFEIHNYQGVNNYNPYPGVVSACVAAGCAGVLLGEWGGTVCTSSCPPGYSNMNQYITAELNAVKTNGMANQWFDYGGVSDKTTGALSATGLLLSQLDNLILGSGSQTTTTTKTSSATTTSTVSSSTTTSASSSSTTTSRTSTTTSATTSGSSTTMSSSSSSTTSSSVVNTSTTTLCCTTSTTIVSSQTSSSMSTANSVSSTISSSSTNSYSTSTSSTLVSTSSSSESTSGAQQPSPTPLTSAYLFPAMSNVAIFSGTMGLLITAFVIAVKLRYNRKRS